MRIRGKIFYFIFISLVIISCRQSKEPSSSFIEIKKLDYPSASATEYYKGKLYVMGDDAPNLLVLDTNFNFLDSIPIISYVGKRIPKDIKPDLEASALISDSAGTVLLFFGSGSLSPYRYTAWRYSIETKSKDSFPLQTWYNVITNEIKQLNIEGACYVGDSLLLVNRGNKSFPKNYLIPISKIFFNSDPNFYIEVISPDKKDTTSFKGISGLCYSKQSDQLIMTVSTEDTRSAHEDGPIGKSYLWIINNISTKLNSESIRPDRIIDLEEIDPRFKGQKIESATIIEETKDMMRLVLVADNDDGSSTIFKMSIK